MFVWLYFISSVLHTVLYTIYFCNDCFCNSLYDVTFSAYAVIKSITLCFYTAPSIRFSDVAVLLAFILLPSAAITLFLIGRMICPKKPTKAYRSPIEVTEGWVEYIEEYIVKMLKVSFCKCKCSFCIFQRGVWASVTRRQSKEDIMLWHIYDGTVHNVYIIYCLFTSHCIPRYK